MIDLQISPLLAVDVGPIISALFMLIMFLVWIGKQILGDGQPAAPPVRRPGRPAQGRDEALQDEIDIFLKDASDPPPPPRRPAPPPARSQPISARQTVTQSTAAHLAPRGPANLGKGIATHVGQHVPTGTASSIGQSHLQHNISASVASHLGQFSGATTAVATESVGAQLRQKLRQRDQVRQLILLNEILARPKSLRR